MNFPTTQLSYQNHLPAPSLSLTSRSLSSGEAPRFLPAPPKTFNITGLASKTRNRTFRWTVRLSLGEQSISKSTADVSSLLEYMSEEFSRLFEDDGGVDRTKFDDIVNFRDPITKHDNISGYLFNIELLRVLFRPVFQQHLVKQDFWDSIENNAYFSLEGLLDVWKQLRIDKTPDLNTPKYQILKQTALYEVRKYEPFIAVEADGVKLTGSSGLNSVTGYIFGKNSAKEKIPMTTPVFTQAIDSELSKVSIQVVLPLKKYMSSLPAPEQETVGLRKVEGGIAAVLKFSGTEDIGREKEKALRSSLT